MSYDLMVFDAAGSPADRASFLSWYSDLARWGDGRLASNPEIAVAAIQAWYRDMIRNFPAVTGPDAIGPAGMENENRAEYRFVANAVFAAFQWEAARHANRQAVKFARIHNVGLFEVSGENGAVWAPTSKGSYQVVHRSE